MKNRHPKKHAFLHEKNLGHLFTSPKPRPASSKTRLPKIKRQIPRPGTAAQRVFSIFMYERLANSILSGDGRPRSVPAKTRRPKVPAPPFEKNLGSGFRGFPLYPQNSPRGYRRPAAIPSAEFPQKSRRPKRSDGFFIWKAASHGSACVICADRFSAQRPARAKQPPGIRTARRCPCAGRSRSGSCLHRARRRCRSRRRSRGRFWQLTR